MDGYVSVPVAVSNIVCKADVNGDSSKCVAEGGIRLISKFLLARMENTQSTILKYNSSLTLV